MWQFFLGMVGDLPATPSRIWTSMSKPDNCLHTVRWPNRAPRRNPSTGFQAVESRRWHRTGDSCSGRSSCSLYMSRLNKCWDILHHECITSHRAKQCDTGHSKLELKCRSVRLLRILNHSSTHFSIQRRAGICKVSWFCVYLWDSTPASDPLSFGSCPLLPSCYRCLNPRLHYRLISSCCLSCWCQVQWWAILESLRTPLPSNAWSNHSHNPLQRL